MDNEKLLSELYKAISAYFSSENEFRRNPSQKLWVKREESDRKLTIMMARVKNHLAK